MCGQILHIYMTVAIKTPTHSGTQLRGSTVVLFPRLQVGESPLLDDNRHVTTNHFGSFSMCRKDGHINNTMRLLHPFVPKHLVRQTTLT